jgi:hypothetical protein
MRALLFVACLITFTGCDQTQTGPTVPIDREFELAPGDAVTIEEVSLSVRFDRVLSDSRCPGDVICVQQGDAVVRLATVSGNRRSELDLHTQDNGRPVARDGVNIALVQLAPYPFLARPIQPGDYRATLRVTR